MGQRVVDSFQEGVEKAFLESKVPYSEKAKKIARECARYADIRRGLGDVKGKLVLVGSINNKPDLAGVIEEDGYFKIVNDGVNILVAYVDVAKRIFDENQASDLSKKCDGIEGSVSITILVLGEDTEIFWMPARFLLN